VRILPGEDTVNLVANDKASDIYEDAKSPAL